MHVAGEASGQQGQQVPVHSDVWGDPKLDSDFRLRDPALPQVNVLGPSPGCGLHGRGLSTATRGRGSPACGARPPGTPPGPRARPPVRFPRSTPAPGPEAARRRRELRAQDALTGRHSLAARSQRAQGGARIGAFVSPNLSGTAPRSPLDPAPRGQETRAPFGLGPSGGRGRGQPHASELPLAACGSGEPIPTDLHVHLWDYFRFRVTPCPALPASLARPGQDGGVRARALPLAHCGRLWWGLYHGYHRRRYLPSGQRFSQFPSGSEPPAAREFDSR